MDETFDQESGGFIPASLPSPAPSNASRGSTASNLPQPRSNPLRAGSAKEEAARRYVESRLLHISRRYTKKFQPPDAHEDVHGYQSITDAAKDLGEVVDVLWLSGTRMSSSPYVWRSVVIKSYSYSQLAGSLPVKCRFDCDYVPPSISTSASGHVQALTEARSCFC